MKTTKKTTLPKKPVTKRDKHMYDLGAKQQAEVFEKAYAHLEGELVAKQTPRKDLLNDYQKPIKIVAIKTVWYVVLGILFGVAFLYAMHGDQQALNAGLIH